MRLQAQGVAVGSPPRGLVDPARTAPEAPATMADASAQPPVAWQALVDALATSRAAASAPSQPTEDPALAPRAPSPPFQERGAWRDPSPPSPGLWTVGMAATLALALAGLYQRIRSHDLLEGSATRRAIFEAVGRRPGVTLSALAREAGVTRATVTYHVHRMASEGLVGIEVFGNRTLVWQAGAEPALRRRAAAILREEAPRRVLAILSVRPDASLRSVAQEAGMPLSTVHGCVWRLRREGLLTGGPADGLAPSGSASRR